MRSWLRRVSLLWLALFLAAPVAGGQTKGPAPRSINSSRVGRKDSQLYPVRQEQTSTSAPTAWPTLS